jgi:hypothetical protein
VRHPDSLQKNRHGVRLVPPTFCEPLSRGSCRGLTMTADEWLVQNGKKPWNPEGHYNKWFWGTAADYDPADPDNEPNETDFLLPANIFVVLEQRNTYPNVKMYNCEEDALDDFRQAYTRAGY